MDDSEAPPKLEPLGLEDLAAELARAFVQRRPLTALGCAVGCGLLLDSFCTPAERQLNRTRLASLIKTAIAQNPEVAQALEQAEALLGSQVPPKSTSDGGAEDGVNNAERG